MIGAIFGDIVGSVYEFNNHRSKDFPLLARSCFFTDDTVMTIALAKALMDSDTENEQEFKSNFINEMHILGEKYPDRGYGGRFALWLARKAKEPYNSYGNGSAMRVSPVGWYAKDLDEAIRLARWSAEVTHNHPEGVKGAVATAGAIFLARTGKDKKEIADFISQYYKIDFTLDQIRPSYKFNETCQKTVPQALACFLEATSFEDAIRNSVSIGGDSDTLGAICGAVAEAFYSLTKKERDSALFFLDSYLKNIVLSFESKYIAD